MGYLLLATAAITLSNCNSLFYYPSEKHIRTPKQINLEFTEHNLEIEKEQSINLWHIEAVGKSKGIVIHFHGNAQNMSYHLPFAAWLPFVGYELITFDYRGYGKSKGEVTREHTIQDGIAVLNWVKEKFPKKKTYILAQSLGGAIALTTLGTIKEKHNIKKVIIDSSFASYRSVAQSKLAQGWLTWPLQYPLKYLVSDDLSPYKFKDKYDNFSFLIFHSTQDPVVPYSNGLELKDIIKGKTEFISLQKPYHTLPFIMANPVWRQYSLDFLKK